MKWFKLLLAWLGFRWRVVDVPARVKVKVRQE
jgi:hypothetical protein